MNRQNNLDELTMSGLSNSGGLPTSNTKWWTITDHVPLERQQGIIEAGVMLAAGGTVAFPTETVYGLGANIRNRSAVECLFAAKGRPSDNPLIVHIADLAQLEEFVLPYNDMSAHLMQRFWPGPLTIVLPVRAGSICSWVTAGLDTVGVRMPAHPTALALIRAAGCPVAAPSANRSGRPSPTCAEHVREDLNGLIDGIVDDGVTGIGVESTVVELLGSRVRILRPGGVTPAMLQEVVSEVEIDHTVEIHTSNTEDALTGVCLQRDFISRSPGMKYVHYAPQGQLHIVQGTSSDQVSRCIEEELIAAKQRGETTGVLAFAEHVGRYRADIVKSLGSIFALEEAAQLLYSALRHFDKAGVTYILAEACSTQGIGLAVMNRLMKAAGHRVILCNGWNNNK